MSRWRPGERIDHGANRSSTASSAPRSRGDAPGRGGPPGALGRSPSSSATAPPGSRHHRPSAPRRTHRGRGPSRAIRHVRPCTMAQSSRAASNGLWPPFLTSEPPMKAIRQAEEQAELTERIGEIDVRVAAIASPAARRAMRKLRACSILRSPAAHRVARREDRQEAGWSRAIRVCARRRFPLRPDGCWLRARRPGADLPAQCRERRRSAASGAAAAFRSPTLATGRAPAGEPLACTSSWARQSAKFAGPAAPILATRASAPEIARRAAR